MEQVKELLELMRGMKASGVVVEVNFILCHVQPYKDRVQWALTSKEILTAPGRGWRD